MLAGHQIKNHLQRTGGTMLGPLDMADQLLKFSNGNIALKVTAASNFLHVRKLDDSAYNAIQCANATFNDSISMGAGKTVDGRDISELVRTNMVSGTYSGDGNDNRNLNIGVDLGSKSQYVIIIKSGSTNLPTVWRKPGGGDETQYCTGVVTGANLIQAMHSTGFQLGTDNHVNQNGTGYHYVVIWQEP
jgi:hypothetical protein